MVYDLSREQRKHHERPLALQFSDNINFLSLSHGLLNQILEFMTEPELYTMACVCVLLNDISLRVLFGQREIGIRDSALDAIYLDLSFPSDEKLLCSLHISFPFTSIRSLTCDFNHSSPTGVAFRRISEHTLDLFVPKTGSSTALIDVEKVRLNIEHSYVKLDVENICERLFPTSCRRITLYYGDGEFIRYERCVTPGGPKIAFTPTVLHIVDREAFQDLPKMLSAMATLEVLYIDTDIILWEARRLLREVMPQQVFPLLTHFRATPAYAVSLMEAAFPILENFGIYVPDVARMFSQTSQQEFKAVTPFLLAEDLPEFEPIVTANFTDGSDIESMKRCLDNYHLNGLASGTSWDVVSTLKIIGLAGVLSRDDQHSFNFALVRWLRLFRGLRHVQFRDINPDDDSELEPSQVYLFLYDIHKNCLGIETVAIYNEIYTVTTFLHEYETGEEGTVIHQPSSFGDFNYDIIFLILEYLSLKDIYALSCLCRNLRDWALSVYLYRRGIKDPLRTVALNLTADLDQLQLTDVSALTLSLERIDKLSLRINPYLNVSTIYEFLSRIDRLVHKLKSIGIITLDFGDDISTIPVGYISSSTKMGWTRLIVRILNTLAEKSNIMHVRGSGVLPSLTYSMTEGGPPKRRLIALCFPSFPLQHSLSALKMNERSAMLPVFNSWVTQALRDSKSIISLELIGISTLSTSLLLSNLGNALPFVQKLRIESARLLPFGILESFTRMLSLTEVTLVGDVHSAVIVYDRDTATPIQKQKETPASLQGLVPPLSLIQRLTTLPQYLTFLMDSGGLPELQYLTILCPQPETAAGFDLSGIRVLSPYAETLKTCFKLDTFNLHVYLQSLMQLKPEEITSDGWDEVACIITGVGIQWQNLRERKRVAEVIMPDVVTDVERAAWTLRAWLSLFPSLRSLEFRDITNFEVFHDILFQLKVAELCPRLIALVVNGNERDVSLAVP